jgi:hypothetical protein
MSTPPKTAFVSAADSKYFPLLIEWVKSIQRFPQSKDMGICILDAGMKEEELDALRAAGCIVKKAEWPCPIPAYKIRGREYLKSCVCRPFIPDYFPEYERYFWMDADTWIQKWEAVELFLKGADKGKVALTAQVDRAYPKCVRIKWLFRMPFKLRGFYFSNAKRAFSFKAAKELYPYHVLLAGAFAMRKDAPHWKRWQELMKKALKKGKVFTAEQLSLGVLCYNEDYPKEILPGYVHWLCEFKPHWDEERKVFVEPSLPHEDIGILHLSGWDEMRVDRKVKTDFETLSGGSVSLNFRYPYFNGETLSEE